jgi:hypothetical protein
MDDPTNEVQTVFGRFDLTRALCHDEAIGADKFSTRSDLSCDGNTWGFNPVVL